MSPESGADRTRKFVTTSSVPVEPVYGPQDAAADSERLGTPGQYPFTRGIHKVEVVIEGFVCQFSFSNNMLRRVS